MGVLHMCAGVPTCPPSGTMAAPAVSMASATRACLLLLGVLLLLQGTHALDHTFIANESNQPVRNSLILQLALSFSCTTCTSPPIPQHLAWPLPTCTLYTMFLSNSSRRMTGTLGAGFFRPEMCLLHVACRYAQARNTTLERACSPTEPLRLTPTVSVYQH